PRRPPRCATTGGTTPRRVDRGAARERETRPHRGGTRTAAAAAHPRRLCGTADGPVAARNRSGWAGRPQSYRLAPTPGTCLYIISASFRALRHVIFIRVPAWGTF